MIQNVGLSKQLHLTKEARPQKKDYIQYGSTDHCFCGTFLLLGRGKVSERCKRMDYKRLEKYLGSDVWFHYLNFGHCFIGVHVNTYQFVNSKFVQFVLCQLYSQ